MKYEYKVLTYEFHTGLIKTYKEKEFESLLNKYGNEGWQLVSCTSRTILHGESDAFVCTFIRVVR